MLKFNQTLTRHTNGIDQTAIVVGMEPSGKYPVDYFLIRFENGSEVYMTEKMLLDQGFVPGPVDHGHPGAAPQIRPSDARIKAHNFSLRSLNVDEPPFWMEKIFGKREPDYCPNVWDQLSRACVEARKDFYRRYVDAQIAFGSVRECWELHRISSVTNGVYFHFE